MHSDKMLQDGTLQSHLNPTDPSKSHEVPSNPIHVGKTMPV
jgi:hypothetical protein